MKSEPAPVASTADREIELIGRLIATPELLEEIGSSSDSELSLQNRLRQRYPADLVRAACTLTDLRRRASGKFSRAARMWFDRVGLEQATSEAVARHKSRRFAKATQRMPSSTVFDLCCGIGGDALALSEELEHVIAVDRSPAACLRTRLNAEVYGVVENIETLVTDVEQVDVAGTYVHIDPDRRAGRDRALRLDDYQPGLEFLLRLIEITPGGGIKLSPASNFGGKFPGCEVELISLHGECKEATVWYGTLAGDQPARATLLPSGFTLTADPWQHRARPVALGRFLYDPDPAIVRAGLVDALTDALPLHRLDASEEYLTGETLVESSAVTAFEVLADLANNPKEIRRYFRQADFHEVEIKCRHVPVAIDEVRRKLPLHGRDKGVLCFARVQGKTRAIVARRL